MNEEKNKLPVLRLVLFSQPAGTISSVESAIFKSLNVYSLLVTKNNSNCNGVIKSIAWQFIGLC